MTSDLRTIRPVFLLLACVAIGGAWLIPNHYAPWTSFYNDACMAVGLLFAFASVARARSFGIPRVAWAVMFLAVIPWLQFVTGILTFSGDAWVATLYLLGLATAIAVGSESTRIDVRTFASALAGAVVVAAIVSCFLAMMQTLQLWGLGIWIGEIFAGMRASANLLQSNNLATLLGWGVLALLLLRERSLLGRSTSMLLLGVLLLGIALTQSRTSLVFGPVIVAGVFIARRRGIVFQTRILTIVIATIIGWGMIFATPVLIRDLLLTSLQTVGERRVESLRFQVWPILADALSQRPWVGFGWLQVGAAELLSADRFPPTGELYLHAHNFFFEMVIWCGYPLGLAIGGGVLYWFVTRTLRVAALEAVIGMLFIALLGIHGMLELPYQYAYFLLPAGLWIGLVEAQVGPAIRSRPRIDWLLPAAALVLFIAVCKDYPSVEEDFRLVRFESLRIGDLHGAEPLPQAPFLSSLTGFLRFSRTVPAAGMSDAQLADMRLEVDRYPYAASLYRLSVALALNGKGADAKRVFIKARHIHGDVLYQRLLQNLHEATLEDNPGQASLMALERSLPR